MSGHVQPMRDERFAKQTPKAPKTFDLFGGQRKPVNIWHIRN